MKKQFPLIVLLGIMVFLGASCRNVSDGGVFKSEDAGITWQPKTYIGRQGRKTLTISSVNVRRLVFAPDDPNTLYLASSNGGLYKSESAGEQWRHLPLSASDVTNIAIDTVEPLVVYAAVGNVIQKTINAGETWSIVYANTQNALMTDVAVDPFRHLHVLATTNSGNFLTSDDGGITWRVAYDIRTSLDRIIIDPHNSQIVYLLERNRNVHKTTDDGATWTLIFTEENMRDVTLQKINLVQNIVVDPNTSTILYSSSKRGLVVSHDAGATWTLLTTLIDHDSDTNLSIRNICVEPGNSNVMYFSVGRLIHKSENGGATWTAINTFPSSRTITNLAFHPSNAHVLYAGTEFVKQKRKGLIQR